MITDELHAQLRELRHELHAHPEVSGNEHRTAERIVELLQRLNPDELITNIGGTGILAKFKGEEEGRDLLFRAELDALPIQEENNVAHRSNIDGVSHKCGHDGHMAILCGLAQQLADQRPAKGDVWLLFQPAEENGEGAKAILADPRSKVIGEPVVFALHNLPGIARGTVMLRDHEFTASVVSIIIKLHGRTSHAAEPEHGVNPALAMSQIIDGAIQLAHNVPQDLRMRVVTPVYARLGSMDYGISAGNGEVHFTLRCWNDRELDALKEDIEQLATSVAGDHGLNVHFGYVQEFRANRNHPKAVEMVCQAARHAGLKDEKALHPFKWGEDFGLFTSKYKGCMFCIGAGKDMPALHNPDYDFPDDIIPHGVAIFERIVRMNN